MSKEISAAVLLLLVALPLNIGVAIAAGVPAENGIISGFIGAVITGMVSRCPMLVSGPDAGIGALVLEMLQKHGPAVLGPLVLIAGVLQLLIGLSRQSRWFRAVSPAVVNGMLVGMGLLIVVTQFHIMLDDSPKETGLANLLLIPEAISKGIFAEGLTPHRSAALLGMFSIFIAYAWSRLQFKWSKMLPPALVAIVLASLVAELAGLSVQKVALPETVKIAFMPYQMDGLLKALVDPNIWLSAVTLTFVISVQTTITINALENSGKNERFNYDRELVAQGTGNLIGGLVGALPVAGVLLRSSANMQSGARTKIPNIGHGIMMILAVFIIPRTLEYIPTGALAAILVYIGCRMILGIRQNLKNFPREEWIILALTVGAILCTNLFTGVLFGLGAAVAKELYRLLYLDIKLKPIANRQASALMLSGAATFVHVPRMMQILADLDPEQELHVHLEKVTYIDHAMLQLFLEWELEHRNKLVIDWDNLGASISPQKKLPGVNLQDKIPPISV